MRKSDLKNGMVVRERDGDLMLFMESYPNYGPVLCALNKTGYLSMRYIKDDLTHRCEETGRSFSGLDIVEVYAASSPSRLYKKELGKLLWQHPGEKTLEIDGKEFSESTIKAALKAYVN